MAVLVELEAIDRNGVKSQKNRLQPEILCKQEHQKRNKKQKANQYHLKSGK